MLPSMGLFPCAAVKGLLICSIWILETETNGKGLEQEGIYDLGAGQAGRSVVSGLTLQLSEDEFQLYNCPPVSPMHSKDGSYVVSHSVLMYQKWSRRPKGQHPMKSKSLVFD